MVKLLSGLMVGLAVLFFTPPAGAEEEGFAIDQVLGRPDAPVTIIEYASTTCSHCANFHRAILPALKAKWIDSGRVKLIYRDFPTEPRPLSFGASMLAHCAGPLRYFHVIETLMARQDDWMNAQDRRGELKRIAQLFGIDEAEAEACWMRKDLLDAIALRARNAFERWKVDSTPTFVIGDTILVGNRSLEELDTVLTVASMATEGDPK